MKLFLLLAACKHGDPAEPAEPYVPPPGFVTDERIVYSDGLHNENTDLLALDDRILLVFRGGETGQVGSALAHLNIYASFDEGATFEPLSTVDAGTLPGGRDIRDPKLVRMGDRVFLYAISRLPGGHYRDLLGDAWTLRAESSDGGETWTDPVKTFTDEDDAGGETYWGFWRFTERSYVDATGAPRQTLYALGYDDGDTAVGLFASDDGVTWEKRSIVVDSYDDVPSEAELQFYGDDAETAVAIVRMDNQGILQDGQSAICTSQDPFTSWECGRRIEQRLDGPKWLSQEMGGVRKEFVVARKHLPCTFKRTAVYELRGDLADPSADIQVCEIEVLPSAGDTAYTSLAALGDDRYLTSWYSSAIPTTGDVAWLEGTYSPSDIWLATTDFGQAPAECNPPPEKEECPIAALPPGDPANAASGEFRLTVAPVIYPDATLAFDATVTAHDAAIDLTLQPLDGTTSLPTGDPWVLTNVAVAPDGTFAAAFGLESLPGDAYPVLADPLPLAVHDFVLTGSLTSPDGFCGSVDGYGQVLGNSASDQIDLRGSTFGAARLDGGEPPALVASCR